MAGRIRVLPPEVAARIAAGEAIERGRPVRIVKVEGNRIVVRGIQGG
mgnify:CR=1 FL=1